MAPGCAAPRDQSCEVKINVQPDPEPTRPALTAMTALGSDRSGAPARAFTPPGALFAALLVGGLMVAAPGCSDDSSSSSGRDATAALDTGTERDAEGGSDATAEPSSRTQAIRRT